MTGNQKRILAITFTLLVIIVTIIILQDKACATPNPEFKCLIIVSGSGGYSDVELGKAASFYDHLLVEYSEEDIYYLTGPSDPNSDGPATLSNIEKAFTWLRENSTSITEIVIYISDHAQGIDPYYTFNDGNISLSTIDSWLDQSQYSYMTIILNGERSGLGGPNLIGSSRDIICSMEADQASMDLFNITRSLEDPEADLNFDGIVDYIEAF
jgi:hypothetical protein